MSFFRISIMTFIKTKYENVSLRKFTYDDIPRLAELANNEKISNNLRDAFPHPYTEKDAETFIGMVLTQEPTQIFAIEYQDLYVGNIGLHLETDVYRKSAEIGYFVGEPYWNLGIMTKAVKLICDYGFEELGIVRIFAGIFEYNHASQRVLEKCGFAKEAIFKQAIIKKGEIYDEIRFAKTYSLK